MGHVVAMLDWALYSFAETDRLLRLTPGTAKRWINGYERGGTRYEPVLREQPSDATWVTWGEFTEARLLAEFRSSIPMIKLRPAVEQLRQYLQVRYPLAHARPFLEVEGRELLLQVQRATDLDEELWMAVVSGQELLLAPATERFTSAVHYDDGTERVVDSIMADTATPRVLLHPGLRQGQPTVDGIRSQTLVELVNAGEPVDVVAATYDLEPADVRQAVQYETTRRRAA